jgi:uncharacterized membrane protein
VSFVAAVRFTASLIDICVALSVVAALARALLALARGRGLDAARLRIADGIVAALSFGVAATVLRVIVLHSWLDIAMLASIYAIRTIVKRALLWESAALRRTGIALP